MSERRRYLLFEASYLFISLIYLVLVKYFYSNLPSLEIPLFFIILALASIFIILIPASINRYITFIYSFIFTLYLIAQDIYLRAFGQYFRLSTALNLYKEAAQVSDSIFPFIKAIDIIPFIILLIITILYIFIYYRYERRLERCNIQRLLAIPIIILSIIAYGSYTKSVKAMAEDYAPWLMHLDYYYYRDIPSTNDFVSRFGKLTLLYRDIEIELTPADVDKEEITSFLNEREDLSEDMMSGIFKDKDVILIQAESFNDIAIDKELTPTLYKLKYEGIDIEGFDTPLLSGSTSDTEFLANTSLIPTTGGACYERANNTYPTTLAKIFKEAGYDTYAMHNSFGSFYNRDVIFETFGYDRFLDNSDLGFDDVASDSEVVEAFDFIYEEDGRYLAYWITYDGHQPYEEDAVGVYREDLQRVKERYPDLEESFAIYLAKNMDLDRAIEKMMKKLEEKGKLDETVFVFFGDHLVKELDVSSDSSIYTAMGLTYDESLVHTDLFIYNSASEPLVYKKTATALDILPTLADLFALDIDMKECLGQSIFALDNEGFYFNESGIYKSDHHIYQSGEYTLLDDITMDEAMKINESIQKTIEISYDILESDYFYAE